MARRVVLGTVGKPHGLAGDVYLWLDPDLADVVVDGLRCRVGGRDVELTSVRRHRGRPLVRFAGVDGRDAVDALRGQTLEVARDQLEVADDVVWADELLHRAVVDADGARVGTVAGLLDGAAHDFLVVRRTDGGELDGGELLVPVVDDIVDLADPVVVHGPPGLLDPGEAID